MGASNEVRVFTVVAMVGLLVLSITLIVHAEHYYIGGYFVHNGIVATTRVIMAANIESLNPSSIPPGNAFDMVLSVAGGRDGAPNGCVYQNSIEVFHNGTVDAVPQVWYGSTMYFLKAVNTNVSTNAIAWYLEIQLPGNGTVVMHLYTYATWLEYEYNAPEKWEHSFYLLGIPCRNNNELLVGVEKHGDYYVKFLQFGIEATSIVGDIDNQWEVQTYSIAYYSNGKWYYLPAKSVLGSVAAITYIGSSVYGVGTLNYNGVNIDRAFTYNDDVFWHYTGVTLPSNTTLWSGSGSITPYPYQQSWVFSLPPSPLSVLQEQRNGTK